MAVTSRKSNAIKLVTTQSRAAGDIPVVAKSLGFIRYKIISGRIYYYWVLHTTVRGKVKQKMLAYLGGTLPKGLRIGRVTPQAMKILKRVARVKGK